MAGLRAIVRRGLELIVLARAALACAIGGYFNQLIANATPIVKGNLVLEPVPEITELALGLKDRLELIGFTTAAAVIMLSGLMFLLVKNEDVRLQGALAISALGYVATINFFVFIGIALVIIPSYSA